MRITEGMHPIKDKNGGVTDKDQKISNLGWPVDQGTLLISVGCDCSWIRFSMVGTLGFYFIEPGEQTWLSVSRNNPIAGIE
jgi:hypothetical protein